MERPKHFESKAAIATLVGGVALYDALCPKGEQISEQCDRILESRIGKVALYGIVFSTALHLTNLIPEKYDWLHQLSQIRPKD